MPAPEGLKAPLASARSRVRSYLGRLWRFSQPIPSALYSWMVIGALLVSRPLTGIRLATVDTQRMGHFVGETDMVLALITREPRAGRGSRRILFVMPRESCNTQVRRMYVRRLSSTPGVRILDCDRSLLGRLLLAPSRKLMVEVMHRERATSIYAGSPFFGGLEYCGMRPSGRPYLSFTDDEVQAGWAALAPLGITSTTRYVCFHIRDSAYLQHALPDRDWSYHDYRNPDPDAYVPALTALMNEGFTVVRMGKRVASALPVSHPRLIDYSLWEGKSDFLDVFLYAHASFAWSGGASGIEQMATAFNRPLVITDLVPFQEPRAAVDDCQVTPCLLREASTGRLLPFSEMMARRFGSSARYSAAGLDIVRNSPDEIWESVHESLSRRAGTWNATPEGERAQAAFWAWADECGVATPLPPGPWSESYYRARLPERFLQRHAAVLMA